MIFRPLCIDYRSRAQEILLLERDAQARRAGRRILPHCSGKELSDDDCGNSNSNLETDSSKDPSNSIHDNSGSGQVVQLKSLSREEIYHLLGPAVHPSECALRPIERASTNRVQSSKPKITWPILEEMTKDYEKRNVEKWREAIVSLESGRSRFRSGDIFSLFLNEFVEKHETNNLSFVEKSLMGNKYDDLFHETMMVLFSKQESLGIPVSLKMPAEIASRSDAIETMSTMVDAPPLRIRHEPPDLNQIHRVKDLRERSVVSFGEEMSVMFHPKLKSLEEKLIDFQSDDAPRRDRFVGPKFNLKLFCDAETVTIDYSSKCELGSFTNFFDELNSKEESMDNGQHSAPPCNVLEAFDGIGSFVRIDPEFPTRDDEPTVFKRDNIDETLNRSLDELCGVASISSKLKLPRRFETGHDIVQSSRRFRVTVNGPLFAFLKKAMEHQSSVEQSSFDSRLKLIESRETGTLQHFVPRKISLESDIKLFEDESKSNIELRPKSRELMSHLPSFSSQLSFSPEFHEKNLIRQSRYVISSARISGCEALKTVVDSSMAPCLFLPQFTVPRRNKSASSPLRKRQSETEDSITRLVRSFVCPTNANRDIYLLQQHNSDYPIKHWFSSNGISMLPSFKNDVEPNNMSMELQREVSKETRLAFCERAQTINRQESLRDLIFTGCISRRNASARYAYRGILTNHLVDPQVHQTRYLSMLDCKKSSRLNHKSDHPTSFVEMTQNVMVASLVRDGRQKKRTAPLANRLRTKRHGVLKVVQKKRLELSQPNVRVKQLHLPCISNMDPQVYQTRYLSMLLNHKSDNPTSFVEMTQNGMVASLVRDGRQKKRTAPLANRLRTKQHGVLKVVQKKRLEPTQLDVRVKQLHLPCISNMISSSLESQEAVCFDPIVEELGETLKKERGELLHLVAKADELEKEEKAYLEELAVLNRHAKMTNDDLFDFTVESVVKRRHPDKGNVEDQNEKRRKKKKRKKDKRKEETAEERAERKAAKKKRKEDRKQKRQRKEMPCNSSSASKKTKLDSGEMSDRSLTEESNLEKPSESTSMKIGITPIVIPKKKDHYDSVLKSTEEKQDNKARNDVIGSVAASHKIKDSTLFSTAKSKSPDSVASLNDGRKLLFSNKQDDAGVNNLTASREIDNGVDNSLGEELGSENTLPGDDNTEAFYDALQAPVRSKIDQTENVPNMQAQQSKGNVSDEPGSDDKLYDVESITLLSSESFLEEFTQVISELASGHWTKTLAPREKKRVQRLANTNVSICDSPLVDLAGVDVELSKEKGLIVNRLSNWVAHGQSIQKSSRTFLRKMVSLASSRRYKCLHIILCLDIDMTPAVSSELVTLQNALVQQSGCHCDHVTFEYVKPRILSSTVALHLLVNHDQSEDLSGVTADENTIERGRFLMMLVPSMTVRMVLGCLGRTENEESEDQSGQALFNLLLSAKTMRNKDFIRSTRTILSDMAAHQLWLALHVDISHAH